MSYLTTAIALATLGVSTAAWAAGSQDKKAQPSPEAAPSAADAKAASASDESEKVNVENIKEKYWARGDESELGVVQNRLYSKQQKWELGVFGGFLTSDPFLAVKSAGASVGFHFSEVWGLHVMGWKAFSSPSSALDALREGGKEANTNPPGWYAGSEVSASILYGKLSLLGKKIIYYDLHLLGGAGVTNTESGTYLTPSLGLGQQIYINKFTSLKLDYRLMYYNETIHEKYITAKLGQEAGQRANWTNSITLGISFLIGGDSK
jgi:outer membrane beta-barrel protein